MTSSRIKRELDNLIKDPFAIVVRVQKMMTFLIGVHINGSYRSV